MLELAPGLVLHNQALDRAAQEALVQAARAIAKAAPLYAPRMPRTGAAMSVRMTNAGPLGWVCDVTGYRYQERHPETSAPWPAIPVQALALWDRYCAYPHPPQACLVNLYAAGARMGLHVDADEAADAPVLSISLGDTALFRYGGLARSDPTRSVRLTSGDILVIGGASRRIYHGVDRIIPGSSTLLGDGGRLNLTLRRVTNPT
jgi:DNA oxidative demethylase